MHSVINLIINPNDINEFKTQYYYVLIIETIVPIIYAGIIW